MLDWVSMYSDTLPATRTYAKRSFTFVPAKPEYRERTGQIGYLLTRLQHARTGVNRNVEIDGYMLERDTPEPGDEGGMAFWLANQTDPDAQEVYRCVVGGLKPKCTCKASKCQVRDDEGSLVCKHFASLTRLIEEGVI